MVGWEGNVGVIGLFHVCQQILLLIHKECFRKLEEGWKEGGWATSVR